MDDMIIVGASGGIGSYLVDAFADEYTLWKTYRNNPIRGFNIARVDVMSHEDVSEFADLISHELSNRIVLVNATGLSLSGMGHKLPSSTFAAVLRVNLVGAFNLANVFLPIMRDRFWGRIINLSSVVGSVGVPGTVAYSASKAGLMGLTRTLAAENALRGITVNALRLGYMSVGMINTIPQDIQESIKRTIPVGGYGTPDNIAEAIRFLVNAPYVTGTAIDIDGGLLCV